MKKKNLYEERLTIWKVKNENEAIKCAEKDAKNYSLETDCEYLEIAQSYELYNTQFRNGIEVYSLMRESNLGSDRYIDRFYDTGDERQRNYSSEF